jgi:hypothetical protein
MANYNASQIGVPYVRASRIIINYPDAGVLPSAYVEQSSAIKLADGTIREIDTMNVLKWNIDLVNHGNDPIPLVDPTTGNALGSNTTYNNLMVQLLAAIRAEQLIQNP